MSDRPSEPVFALNLFRGTAADYDRYRLGYPDALASFLRTELALDGTGRLLDLGCATGQVARCLRADFDEVWAVDAEADMIDYASVRYPDIRWFVARAEELDAPEAHFDLVTSGNAFHRFDRPVVAAKIARWLKHDGALALIGSAPPPRGEAAWQVALREVTARWQARTGAAGRIPTGWQREDYPDEDVLRDAGFARVERREFTDRHASTVDELIGFLRSGSATSREAMGERAEEFYADVRARLLEVDGRGEYEQVVSHGVVLARR